MKWLLLLLLYSLNVVSQATITIKGNIINDLEGYDKIYFKYNGEPEDSVRVVNGNFEIIMPFRKDDTPWLYDEYTIKKTGGYKAFNILIEHPGILTLHNVDLNKGFFGTVSGMQSAEDYEEFYSLVESSNPDVIDELKEKFPVFPEFPTDGKFTPEYLAFDKYSTEVITKYRLINLEKFIQTHTDSYASVYLLNMEMRNMKAEAIKRNYSLLTKKRQNSEEGKDIVRHLNGLKASQPKKQIKDFVLLDPNGKKISTKSLRGKYVILDFWASWCRPCIAEFPDFKKLHKKYRNKNFEILSISVDKSSEAWLKALKKQQLTWLQAIDDKNSQASNFAVSAYPTKFLIDPNGKIIMRDGDIEKKLREIFGY